MIGNLQRLKTAAAVDEFLAESGEDFAQEVAMLRAFRCGLARGEPEKQEGVLLLRDGEYLLQNDRFSLKVRTVGREIIDYEFF